MGTFLFLLCAVAGGWYAYRRARISDSDWAKVVRVIVWGEDRPK